ncbi:MAG: FAD/NAD(P)-binding protein, partial [bacterium]
MGPRGASLLERLITHLIERNACQEVHLCLFEKDQEPGSGCHHTRLPADLLTTTVAGQVTMYFGQELEDYGPVHAGPSLYNWHQREQNPNVSATDYLPRRELGRYL